MIPQKPPSAAFDDFSALMDTLLGENGCPWDREQTHESLRRHLLEEAYETVEAINQNDMPSLCEELGDVFLQVMFHAKLAEKSGEFTIDDVITAVTNKLVSRHTHIFGTEVAENAEDVIKVWERNKEKERSGKGENTLNSVPKALPSLMRAEKVLKRAGETLPNARAVADDITIRLQNMFNHDNNVMLSDNVGWVLFLMVKLALILKVNPEFALTNVTEAFINTNSPENPAVGGYILKEDTE